MPFAESTQAASLTFDAAVNRALARRVSDTPLHAPAPVLRATPETTPASSQPQSGAEQALRTARD